MTAWTLEELGWSSSLAAERGSEHRQLLAGRVSQDHRILYTVQTEKGPRRCRVRGRLRAAKASIAVGDWVLADISSKPASIEVILPRRTAITRGTARGPQVLAANVDVAFIVTSPDEARMVPRLERFIHVVVAAGAEPVLVLNKCDLSDDRGAHLEALAELSASGPVEISAKDGAGLEGLSPWLGRGRTVVLLGASGVGKSTMANALVGEDVQATGSTRAVDGKGRHTTTVRTLLPFRRAGAEGVLIDTPGLREIVLIDGVEAESIFEDIIEMSEACRFRDCAHRSEPDCAVQAAVKAGRLNNARLEAFFRVRDAP